MTFTIVMLRIDDIAKNKQINTNKNNSSNVGVWSKKVMDTHCKVSRIVKAAINSK